MKTPEVPIGSLVKKCSTWDPKKFDDDEFIYVDLSSVDKDQKSITRVERVRCSKAPSRARQLIKTNDVLVATVRPNLNGVALVNADHDGATASTGYCVLRPDPEKMDARFLFHWVKTSTFVARMIDVATGANYPAVSDAKVKNSSIPFPALAEQKRIAKILDAADALRAKRHESIAQLDALLQSTFLEMFGDPVTNPKGWAMTTIPEIAIKFTDGPFGSNLKSSHYVSDGIRVIRLQNIGIGEMLHGDLAYISQKHYESLPRNHCEPGDIIIGTLGDPNLRACIVPPDLPRSLNKADCLLLRVDPSLATNQFVCWLLNCPTLVSKALELVRGQTRGRISMGRLKKLRIILPPSTKQQHFSTIVESIEQQKSRFCAHLAELDALFASLQARAFAGEL